MDLNKIDPAALEFSDEEMDALVQILTKADQIQKDHTLMRLVQKHMDKSVKEIKSMDDLKKHAKRLDEESRAKEKEPDDDEDDKPSEDAQ